MVLTVRALGVLLVSGAIEVALGQAAVAAVTALPGDLALTGPTALERQLSGALVLLAVATALVAWTGWCLGVLRALWLPVARTTPSRWVRVAATVLGVSAATLGVATPALGDGADPAPPTLGADLDLDGLPLPDLPVSATQSQPPREPRDHVVAPGESLWAIAASRLPGGATAAAVDRLWRRWYAANRGVIGPDPDLIVPGQLLHPPANRRSTR